MSNQKKISVMLFDDALAHTDLADRISVPTQRTLTDAGQMHVPCKFARTGAQRYLASQVFRTKALLDQEGLKPNDIIVLNRDESTVFDEESMETFRSAPVTIGHPKDTSGNPIAVTAENSKELQVGVLEGMPVRDEDTLGGTLVLTAQEAIDALEEGTQELSAGYGCDIIKIGDEYYQRNVRANHIAIVPKGRAGSSCRISDEALVIEDEEIRAQLTDAQEELAAVKAKLTDAEGALQTQTELTDSFKETAEKAELKVSALEIELADAKVAAEEGVVERCTAIENARLIADMRDLGDKSVEQIHKLVVEDQYPEKDFSGKSPAFIEAMFEMLVDQANGETPMSKLIKQQTTHITIDAAPVDKAAESRKAMIQRQAKQFNK